METKEDDVVYVIAVRARAGDGGKAFQDALKELNAAKDGEAYATVLAMPLREAYSLNNGRPAPGNVAEAMIHLGFKFEEANQVVPVVSG